MSSRIHLLLIPILLVSACAPSVSNDPGPDKTEGAVSDQESPWWKGRTWEGEIDTCANAIGDVEGCRWLADTLRERGCALKTFETIAVGMSFGLSLDVLHAEAASSSDCSAMEP